MVQQRGSSPMTLDASSITPRLWVGGRPPFDRSIEVDILVLCAREIQPMSMAFTGAVLRCPLPDAELDLDELSQAIIVAGAVGRAIMEGRSCLVTCAMGMNRSALVASFALGKATKMSADEIVELMRRRRKVDGVLSNEHFVGYLKQYIGQGRR